jgi:predicted  nucleic acid-binding Zn-ribbon protein
MIEPFRARGLGSTLLSRGLTAKSEMVHCDHCSAFILEFCDE